MIVCYNSTNSVFFKEILFVSPGFCATFSEKIQFHRAGRARRRHARSARAKRGSALGVQPPQAALSEPLTHRLDKLEFEDVAKEAQLKAPRTCEGGWVCTAIQQLYKPGFEEQFSPLSSQLSVLRSQLSMKKSTAERRCLLFDYLTYSMTTRRLGSEPTE